jgi:AraC-like DNA-binding protein
MFYEPTSLALITNILAITLREDYNVDPEPVFAGAGIDVHRKPTPQMRYTLSQMRKLWELALDATGDEAIGLKTGWHVRPANLYAFGYSWMASDTLLDAMQRLCRYHSVLSTASIELALRETPDAYALSADFPDDANSPPREGIETGMTALLRLCRIVAEEDVFPVRVELICDSSVHPEAYRQALQAPITFNADVGTFYFDKGRMLKPLPGGTPDVAEATDKISEQYIETLDPHAVASHVRRLLVALLPAGAASQNHIAKKMNRSSSTLQRQLQSEGMSFRDVLEGTRRSLAEEYLRDRKQSHAQIAYQLGFSDQSNFSRAFKDQLIVTSLLVPADTVPGPVAVMLPTSSLSPNSQASS